MKDLSVKLSGRLPVIRNNRTQSRGTGREKEMRIEMNSKSIDLYKLWRRRYLNPSLPN